MEIRQPLTKAGGIIVWYIVQLSFRISDGTKEYEDFWKPILWNLFHFRVFKKKFFKFFIGRRSSQRQINREQRKSFGFSFIILQSSDYPSFSRSFLFFLLLFHFSFLFILFFLSHSTLLQVRTVFQSFSKRVNTGD